MARVQEGAFDPGPPPPEPQRVEEQPAEQPKEDLRAKCLRRLKEQEANEAKPLDYGMFSADADPGDAATLAGAYRRLQDHMNRQAVAALDVITDAYARSGDVIEIHVEG